MDEFRERVLRLWKEVVAESGKEVVWKPGPMSDRHPRISIEAHGEKSWFQIDQEEEAIATTDEQLREIMRLHLSDALRPRRT